MPGKSQEHRAKISAAMKGKAKSDEHREAIRAAVTAYWESPQGQEERATRREMFRRIRLENRRARAAEKVGS